MNFGLTGYLHDTTFEIAKSGFSTGWTLCRDPINSVEVLEPETSYYST